MCARLIIYKSTYLCALFLSLKLTTKKLLTIYEQRSFENTKFSLKIEHIIHVDNWFNDCFFEQP